METGRIVYTVRTFPVAALHGTPTIMKIAYRAEIDGLRTIAVLGVLLFHLKIALFSGGFAGVDVFFVISGYLITSNILSDAQSNRFSFVEFYVRRARRILPALIFTVVVTFIFGLLFLHPLAMRVLAKESTNALLSISNFQYLKESKNYFAPASDQLALLHCWSLSVEEQFYLVWPLLTVLALRWKKLLEAILIAAIASFCLAMFWNSHDPQAVFFLMPFRIFEFAIGAAIIFVEARFRPSPAVSEALSAIGIAAIGATFIFFDDQSSFAAVTLIPCLGAAAVIIGGKNSVTGRLLLTNRPVIAIGRASYSLYLCHWPIIFFARIILGEVTQTWQGKALLFVLMIALSFAMRRFIERPFRKPAGSVGAKSAAISFGLLIAITAAVTHTTFKSEGLRWRIKAEQWAVNQSGRTPCKVIDGRRCEFGDLESPIQLEMMGDSFVQQYVAAFDPLLKARHMKGAVTVDAGCPMLVSMPYPLKHWGGPKACADVVQRELAKVHENSTLIVISQNWKMYQDSLYEADILARSSGGYSGPYSLVQASLEKTISDLGRSGRKFLIVGAQTIMDQCTFDWARMFPGPLPHAPAADCAPKSRDQALKEGAELNAMLRKVQEKWPDQVKLLIPVDAFCDDQCPVVRDGVWLYYDEGHFTEFGSKYMGERSHKVLADFLDSVAR